MDIVSACLVGLKCRYDGGHKACTQMVKYLTQRKVLPLCPEQLGGLPTPRLPVEFTAGSGIEVLIGQARVINTAAQDVTAQFIQGAEQTLYIARLVRAKRAFLKQKSPSCGFGYISQRDKVFPGLGVTAALLVNSGIEIIPLE